MSKAPHYWINLSGRKDFPFVACTAIEAVAYFKNSREAAAWCAEQHGEQPPRDRWSKARRAK